MKKALKTTHLVVNIILIIALVVSAALLVLTTFSPVKSISIYKVVSGSMEPSIHTGSAVITRNVDVQNLQKDDVISFTEINTPTIITHRIVDIKNTESGLVFNTKGDANNITDINEVTADKVLGKVIISIPLVGYLMVWVKQPLGFALTIVLPALFIIITELVRIKKTIEEGAVKKFKKKQSGPIDTLLTSVLFLSIFSSLAILGKEQTLSYFSDGIILDNNVFSTTCWAGPSIPVLLYPENGSTKYKNSDWDLNPYMDWEDSKSECSIDGLKITYIYESYRDEGLTQRAYTSQPLSESKIPAPGTPSGTYWWRVKSCDSLDHCSKFSDAFSFTYNPSITEPTKTDNSNETTTLSGATTDVLLLQETSKQVEIDDDTNEPETPPTQEKIPVNTEQLTDSEEDVNNEL